MKNKFNSTLVCVFMVYCTLTLPDGKCRWDTINPYPTVNDLNDIWGMTSESLFACGTHGTIVHWNGMEWNQSETYTNAELKAIFGISSNDVFAVGIDYLEYSGVILHWDGTSWIKILTDTDYGLNAVWSSGHNDAFAVGTQGRIYRWNGETCLSMESPVSTNLQGIWGFSSDDAFAVGVVGTAIHWNGTHWQELDTGSTAYLKDIWGSSSDDLYAVGGIDYDSIILHWNGSSWTDIPCDLNEDLVGVFGGAEDDVFIISNKGTTLHWDGSNLTVLGSTPVRSIGLGGTEDHEVFLAGTAGAIQYWDGQDWQFMNHTVTRNSLYGIWGFSKTDVFAVGREGTILHWDGTTLTTMESSTTELLQSVWGNSSDDVYAVGYSGTILHWNGSNWSSIPPITNATLNDIWGSASDDIFIVGGNYSSENGTILHWDGLNWTLDESSAPEGLNTVWGTSSQNVIAAGWENTIIHFNGSNWNPRFSEISTSFYDSWGIDADDIYLVGAYTLPPGGGYLHHWNGSTWEVVFSVTGNLSFITGLSSNDILIGPDNRDSLWRWDAQTWESFSCPSANEVNSMWSDNLLSYFAIGRDGRFMRYSIDPGIRFAIPRKIVKPWNEFYLKAYLDNPGNTPINASIFVALDIYGEYWFWDDWTHYNPSDPSSIDYQNMDIPSGMTTIDVIPTFTWPDTAYDRVRGIYFWGAIMDQNLQNLIGDIALIEWGYGPR